MPDVNFILVHVDDVDASEAFYTSILGRRAVESSPTFAMMPAAPGLMHSLWKREGVMPKATPSGGGEIAFAASGKPEVDALFAEWRGLGVAIAQEPTAWTSAILSLASTRTGSACASSRPPPRIDRRGAGTASGPRSEPLEQGGRQIAFGE